MSDRQALNATICGAVVGAAVGYLFFTEGGRALRRRIEPALDDLQRDLTSFRGTMQRAAGMATEGWRLLNEMAAEPGAPARPATHQTSPF